MRGRRASIERRLRLLEIRAHRHLARLPARVACPCCGWTGARFAPSIHPRKPNRLCPSCGSTERYRALELLLDDLGTPTSGRRLLEVAPTGPTERAAIRRGYDYTSVDLSSLRARVRGDLTAMPFADGTFDLIVCFHVLEHIVDDRTAVAELVRTLAPDGTAIVVVPWDEARPETFEVEGADPSERLALYGQSDHVRIYGADLVARWDRDGIAIEVDRWDDRWDDATATQAALRGNDDRFWHLRHAGRSAISS